MSFIFCDSFDSTTFTLDKWTTMTNVSSVSYVSARTGLGIKMANNGHMLQKTVASANYHATFIVGVAVKRGAPSSSGRINLFNDGGIQVYLLFDTDGSLKIYRNETGSPVLLITSDADKVRYNTWHYIEFLATISDVSGVVTARVDGVQVLNLTSCDTRVSGTSTFYGVILNNADNDVTFDDFYICNGAGSTNNTFLGDVELYALFPSAAGTTTQLTSSSGGANYTNVDEYPPNTSDYNYSSTDNQYDTYAFQNTTVDASSVIPAVQVLIYAWKSDTGAKSIAPMVRSGGTDYTGNDYALSQDPTYAARQIYETNPNTSAAWTTSGIDNAEFGVKVRP